MFRFHIDHPVKLADLQWTGDGRWANHDSWIEPLTHPVLEHRAVLGPDGRGFVNQQGTPPRHRRLQPRTGEALGRRRLRARTPPGHRLALGFVLVELTEDSVTVTAGSWGVAPVHLTTTGGGALCGAWDLLDLIDHIPIALDPIEAVRFLTYRPVYSTRTLLRGVQTVTERASGTFTRPPCAVGRLGIDYPEPGLHALPRGPARRRRPRRRVRRDDGRGDRPMGRPTRRRSRRPVGRHGLHQRRAVPCPSPPPPDRHRRDAAHRPVR